MTVGLFEQREEELLELIHEKLKTGTYRFKPARRTLIPKQDTDCVTVAQQVYVCEKLFSLLLQLQNDLILRDQ